MGNIIISTLTGRSASSLLADPDYTVSPQIWDKINQICDDLKEQRPLQYILGHTEFMGRLFEVNPSVLIPRPETEELVDLIIRENRDAQLSVADIGTGSGIIAVTLALGLDNSGVVATDISITALETAARNAHSNGAAVSFVLSDILDYADGDPSPPHSGTATPEGIEPTTGVDGFGAGNVAPDSRPDFRFLREIPGRFDIIVSNPPYVRESEKERMESNVLMYEPHNALFVADADPLIFYRAIFSFAKKNLKPGGRIYLEINEALGEETVSLACKWGYSGTRLIKDINGRNRIVVVKNTGSKDSINRG